MKMSKEQKIKILKRSKMMAGKFPRIEIMEPKNLSGMKNLKKLVSLWDCLLKYELSRETKITKQVINLNNSKKPINLPLAKY
jgi:hypothetical protein